MNEQQERVALALMCANEDSPPLVQCPSCGWSTLAYRNWFNGMRVARDYKCRECGWGQSGPIYSAILDGRDHYAMTLRTEPRL